MSRKLEKVWPEPVRPVHRHRTPMFVAVVVAAATAVAGWFTFGSSWSPKSTENPATVTVNAPVTLDADEAAFREEAPGFAYDVELKELDRQVVQEQELAIVLDDLRAMVFASKLRILAFDVTTSIGLRGEETTGAKIGIEAHGPVSGVLEIAEKVAGLDHFVRIDFLRLHRLWGQEGIQGDIVGISFSLLIPFDDYYSTTQLPAADPLLRLAQLRDWRLARQGAARLLDSYQSALSPEVRITELEFSDCYLRIGGTCSNSDSVARFAERIDARADCVAWKAVYDVSTHPIVVGEFPFVVRAKLRRWKRTGVGLQESICVSTHVDQ